LLAALLLGAAVQPPKFDAADPAAPRITEANVFENERFWPYQVELTKPFTPAGRKAPLEAGTLAVLVRLERPGVARIDFGRDGRAEVPVGATDIVARADRIRLGEEQKIAPNLVFAIGTRLVDSAAPSIQGLDLGPVYAAKAFVAVFADPASDGFAGIAEGLKQLGEREGVLVVLFAKGEHPDRVLRERLRKLAWTVPFLRDSYSEGYISALRADHAPMPSVMVLTPDGRVLLDAPWNPERVGDLESALDVVLGSKPDGGARAKGEPK
jgi:hypothetical protein